MNKKNYDGMRYPSVDALLEKIDSKYKLAYAAAKRAKIIEEEDQVQIYTSGTTNILKYPELSDKNKASEILNTFEEKQMLSKLISDKMDGDNQETGIQVYIGNESPIETMKDCSLVTATYKLEEGVYGKVGIIGPKRMDYEKVVEALQDFMVQLDSIFKEEK